MSDFKEVPHSINPNEKSSSVPKVTFDKFFSIDPEKDGDGIKDVLGRLKKDRRYGDPVAPIYELSRLKESGGLQYSNSELEQESWTDEDYELSQKTLKEERIQKFFSEFAARYEQVSPIADSRVRLDQESAIGEDLDNNNPVLIRGAWRLGKTSMLMSLMTHKYGRENTMFFDVVGYDPGRDVEIEDFRQEFGLFPVASFIAEREIGDGDYVKQGERRRELIEAIQENGTQPFEYLDGYLEQKQENIFLAVDEAILYGGDIDKLNHIAQLKRFKNFKFGVVMHRNAAAENGIAEAFEGFQTHFIRALTEEEVATLVRGPLTESPITFSDEAIREIHRFSGGRPMEVNNLCRALFDNYSEFKQYKFDYSLDDIKKITEAEMWDLLSSSGPFQHAVHNYRRVYQILFSDDERKIIDRLIKQEVPISELDESAMSSLVDTTYVVRDEEAGVFRAGGDLFAKVISSS